MFVLLTPVQVSFRENQGLFGVSASFPLSSLFCPFSLSSSLSFTFRCPYFLSNLCLSLFLTLLFGTKPSSGRLNPPHMTTTRPKTCCGSLQRADGRTQPDFPPHCSLCLASVPFTHSLAHSLSLLPILRSLNGVT
ncbi:Hypothetical predicted protein [Xyrichtys novacula]|uniref:Transmembrane protein n=1 Tax=Xyrichtys novacula TaxID=13765 RepID=A0AAV1GMH8_XYRNO|nr:Hypothetical predicted protein [Xyrichtys novacula]